MSKYEIYMILKELGGSASAKEIKNLAREKFPSYTLYTYVNNRLMKLEKSGLVKRTLVNDLVIWKIIDEWH